jgi:hypothetical protein
MLICAGQASISLQKDWHVNQSEGKTILFSDTVLPVIIGFQELKLKNSYFKAIRFDSALNGVRPPEASALFFLQWFG